MVDAEEGDAIVTGLQLADGEIAEAVPAARVLVENTLSLAAPNNHSLAKQGRQGFYRIVVVDMEAAEPLIGRVW